MSETAIVAIIGLLATVAAAAITPAISARAGKNRAQDELAEQRRQQQVELLAQTLASLKRYSELQFSYLKIIAQLPSETISSFDESRIGSEPMRDLWASQRESTAKISHAQITIRNEQISRALKNLDDQIAFATEGLESELKEREKELSQYALRKAYAEKKHADFNQAILDLELASRAALASGLRE